jgi:tetratricopeptide (TPR) repeat protein
MLRRIVIDAREEEDLRSVALGALGALRDPAEERFLLGFLKETRVLELRSDAAAALAQLPGGRGVPLLLEALTEARASGDEDGFLVLISALPQAPEPAVAAFLWELLFERRLGPHAPHADLAPRENAVLDALCRLGDEAARRGWEAFASRRAPGEVRAAGELFHFRAAQFFERRRREGLALDAWARVLVTPPRASRKDLLAAQALAAGAEDAGDLGEAGRLWEEAARIASLEGYASESATDAPGLFDLERWRALAASARLREAARDGDEAGLGRALEDFLAVAPRRFDLQAETARDLEADGVGLEVALLLAERAVLLAPADPVALDALGAVRLQLGGDALGPLDRAALAARLFQETPPRLYLHRAVALARAGRKTEAMADLREAFRAEPELRARLREDPDVGELLRGAEALEEGR